ncbi:MAG: hypothetical protein ACJ71K_09220 [Nitrososphaeraceae archaeon]
MQVSIGTVNRDLSILRQQAKANIKKYIDQRLPEEREMSSRNNSNTKRSMD